MSYIIFDYADKIVLCDSLLEKITKTADICTACAEQTNTNCANVEIAKCISFAIIAIVSICVAGYVMVKLISLIFAQCSETKKRKREVEDRNFKQKSLIWSLKLEWLKSSGKSKEYLDELDKCLAEFSPKSESVESKTGNGKNE